MSVQSHLSQLQKKHEMLSQQVETTQRSPGSNDMEIKALKKQKLQLKQEINKLSQAH